jgi:mRNA interferase YafQ
MRKLISTPRFDRSLRKFTRRNSVLEERVRKTLEQMTEDVFFASLGTHKLDGNLDGIYACYCGYDCRVLFSIEPDSELIILLDVGNHDDVY